MELVFQEKQVHYLDRIVCQDICLEQTADLIVPDSMSDIERVVDAHATALVRSTQCNASAVNVEGTAQTVILFVGEDGALQRMTAQIPFSVRREFTTQQEDCMLQCKCSVCSVDARALNSRKLLVRVGICCAIRVYAPKECMLYDMSEPAPNLQLKRTRLPLSVAQALGEKNFVLNEELEIPSAKPLVERLLKCNLQTRIDEQKLVGDKAVFKASLLIKALYESEEEKLISCQWELPFSQYVPMSKELEECTLETELCLTSSEIEPDAGANRLLLSVGFLAQCTAFGEQTVDLIDDAFCTDAAFEPQYSSFEMVGILDRQNLHENAAAVLEEPNASVVDAWVYAQEVDKERTEDHVLLHLPLQCNVLYYDEQGNLQGKTLRANLHSQTALSEKGQCYVTEICSGDIYCSTSANAIQVRLPITMTVESSANHCLQAVCGGQITPLEQCERRASVLLRRTQEQEDLWQIAKACRTSVANILQANGLQEETVEAGTMLLIPL